MKTWIENAILRNLLAESMRVYGGETGHSTTTPAVAPAARLRVGSHARLGSSDLKTENAVLRNLLSTTAEAYENRLQAFRAEKELVRHVLAATRDAVVTTDAAGSVTSMNPAAEDLTGWSLEQARGRSVAEMLRLVDETGADVELELEPCLAEGGEVDLAAGLMAVRRDGSKRPVGGHAAAIHDRLHGVLGAVVILFHDP